MTFWSERRVLITGGHGFLGSAIRRLVEERRPRELHAPQSSELDLRERDAIRAFLAQHHPDVVIHAAAVVGGIGANQAHPGRFFYENATMGIQLIEECRRAGVEKFVCIGTVCAYPKFTPTPFHESDLWNGYPEETNAPYGVAKKMLLVQLQSYRTEYGFNGVFVLPANLYGPNDNFDYQTSHVIPALIRKVITAKAHGQDYVVVWGDGTPTREFLYVDDAARGIVMTAERYESPEPMNLGTGEEVTIKDLVQMISEALNFKGTARWDYSKPNGQPRRRLDITRALQEIGFKPEVSLREGVTRTAKWYLNECVLKPFTK